MLKEEHKDSSDEDNDFEVKSDQSEELEPEIIEMQDETQNDEDENVFNAAAHFEAIRAKKDMKKTI